MSNGLTEDQMISLAKPAHDRRCSCDAKYIMACSIMAAEILKLGKVNQKPTTMEELVKQCIVDSRRWFPRSFETDLLGITSFLTLCVNGESGELANKVKKILRGSVSFSDGVEAVIEEAMDIQIYLANLFGELGVDVFEEYWKKRQRNEERFGGRTAQWPI